MSWATPLPPYPVCANWGYDDPCRTKATRHPKLAVVDQAGKRYVHRVRGVWLRWNADRTAADFVAGWECSGDGSFRIGFVPDDASPTCPICIDNQLSESMGVSPGTWGVYYALRGGLIKIGTTQNVGARIRALKADHLMAIEPGSYDIERATHQRFDHLRKQGEWFRPGSDLLDHIEALAS